MEKRNRAAVAAPKTNGKGTKKNGIISIETAEIIHFLFGTPTAKMPIKKRSAK